MQGSRKGARWESGEAANAKGRLGKNRWESMAQKRRRPREYAPAWTPFQFFWKGWPVEGAASIQLSSALRPHAAGLRLSPRQRQLPALGPRGRRLSLRGGLPRGDPRRGRHGRSRIGRDRRAGRDHRADRDHRAAAGRAYLRIGVHGRRHPLPDAVIASVIRRRGSVPPFHMCCICHSITLPFYAILCMGNRFCVRQRQPRRPAILWAEERRGGPAKNAQKSCFFQICLLSYLI